MPKTPAALLAALSLAICLLLSSCADNDHTVVISTVDQRMLLLDRGQPLAAYPVSTSKFGLGDVPGRCQTPLGAFQIANKIGDGAPAGAVFKSRRPTGEIVPADAPGRDPIVTRILWLRGLEPQNANAFERDIYIHGTPEERNIGLPVSYGCVRMRSRDVTALYNVVGTGARVFILDEPMTAAALRFLAPGAILPPAALPPLVEARGSAPPGTATAAGTVTVR